MCRRITDFFCFLLQVVQVLNADAMVVKLNSGDYKTIHLASIRPPRLEGEGSQVRVELLLLAHTRILMRWCLFAFLQNVCMCQ